jgi:hypothetical protein
MSEKRACFIIGAGRRLGGDVARGEPSHIHLPRRRRATRPDDQGNGPTWAAHTGDEDQRGHGQPAPTAQV